MSPCLANLQHEGIGKVTHGAVPVLEANGKEQGGKARGKDHGPLPPRAAELLDDGIDQGVGFRTEPEPGRVFFAFGLFLLRRGRECDRSDGLIVEIFRGGDGHPPRQAFDHSLDRGQAVVLDSAAKQALPPLRRKAVARVSSRILSNGFLSGFGTAR